MSEPLAFYRPDFDKMYHDERQMFDCLVRYHRLVLVEPDDIMNAAHKLVHPMYDNAADCDKFWCEPFRALKKGIGGDEGGKVLNDEILDRVLDKMTGIGEEQ